MNRRLQQLPDVRTVLKQADRDRLASLGLPDEAIIELAELVVDVRDKAAEISTPATWRRGMDGLTKPITVLQAALGACDGWTRDLIDAAIHKTARIRPMLDTGIFDVARLRAELVILAESIQRIRKSDQVKRLGGGGDLKRSIAESVCRIVGAHGIAVDDRPKGPANIALQIILETVGLPVRDSRNYLRPKSRRTAGK